MGLKCNYTASWSISLDTVCPRCSEDYDLLEQDPDLMTRISPMEQGTTRTASVETVCPHCSYEFEVELDY